MIRTNYKSRRYINILIGIAVVLGISFIIIGNLRELESSTSFQIDVGSESDNDITKRFYIQDSPSLNERVRYGSTTYREIGADPINLEINYNQINNFSKALIQLNLFNSNSDVYLNNKLIFPGTKNYELIREFEDSYLYKNRNISKVQETNNNSAIDFIIKNYYGSSVYSFKLLERNYQDVEGFTHQKTKINNTFRDNLNLAFYIEGDLYLNFVKKDINSYEGKDAYHLTIKSLNGTIIYMDELGDDGDVSRSEKGKENYFEKNIPNLKGIYYLDFRRSDKGEYADSTIKDIEINTNKVVINGNFLPLEPIHLYAKNYFNRNISFYHWREGSDQVIDLVNNGVWDQINLNSENRGKNYNYNINPGELTIDIPKGYVWIFNKFALSLSEDNWFEIPAIIQERIDNPDFLILDKKKIKINKNGIILYEELDLSNLNQTISISSSGQNRIKLNSVSISLQ